MPIVHVSHIGCGLCFHKIPPSRINYESKIFVKQFPVSRTWICHACNRYNSDNEIIKCKQLKSCLETCPIASSSFCLNFINGGLRPMRFVECGTVSGQITPFGVHLLERGSSHQNSATSFTFCYMLERDK